MNNKEFLEILERELELNSLKLKQAVTNNTITQELLQQRSNIKDIIIAVLKNEVYKQTVLNKEKFLWVK